jgi:hypothetical protein
MMHSKLEFAAAAAAPVQRAWLVETGTLESQEPVNADNPGKESKPLLTQMSTGTCLLHRLPAVLAPGCIAPTTSKDKLVN